MKNATEAAKDHVKTLYADAFQRLGTPVYYSETVEKAFVAGVNYALDRVEELFKEKERTTRAALTVRDEEEI